MLSDPVAALRCSWSMNPESHKEANSAGRKRGSTWITMRDREKYKGNAWYLDQVSPTTQKIDRFFPCTYLTIKFWIDHLIEEHETFGISILDWLIDRLVSNIWPMALSSFTSTSWHRMEFIRCPVLTWLTLVRLNAENSPTFGAFCRCASSFAACFPKPGHSTGGSDTDAFFLGGLLLSAPAPAAALEVRSPTVMLL